MIEMSKNKIRKLTKKKFSFTYFIQINNTVLLEIFFFFFVGMYYLIVKRKEMESYYDGKYTGSHQRVMSLSVC